MLSFKIVVIKIQGGAPGGGSGGWPSGGGGGGWPSGGGGGNLQSNTIRVNFNYFELVIKISSEILFCKNYEFPLKSSAFLMCL